MRIIFLILFFSVNVCLADGKPPSQLMAYDLNACVDVVLSEVEDIAYIKRDDPLLLRVRNQLDNLPNSSLLVGYDGALSAGKYAPNYRIYCLEQADEADQFRRKQLICYQENGQTFEKIIFRPKSEFEGQVTFECTNNCAKASFKNIYEMALDEGYDMIPAQGRDVQLLRACK